ncbi:MAG: hypothetical protein U0736_27000 [Gemmataceae bacterium]
MSTLGKVLALLNVLGALGLGFVALLDYNKRQAWAYSVFRHELVLRGLPITDQELDTDQHPLVDRMSEETLQDLFKQAGANPVLTQVQEVERLKGQLDQRLQAVAASKPGQANLYARILLPLADAYLEREVMQVCRAHFATEQTVAALKARCRNALAEALTPPKVAVQDAPDRSFAEAFRLAFREQPGEPAEVFVTDLLREIPDDREKATRVNLDAEFDKAIEKQRKTLEDRYAAVFAEALGNAAGQPAGKPAAHDPQKAAVARLLFGLCPFLAEDAILTDPGRAQEKATLQGPTDRTLYQARLVETPTFKATVTRMYTVCGFRYSLNAIADRTAAIRRLSEYVLAAAAQERHQFMLDHAFIIDQIREQAALVQAEQRLVAENKDRLASADEVVKLRQTEIAQVEDELRQARAVTDAEIKTLREKSYEVLTLRQKIRDAITANEQGERRIRELEKQARDLDRRDR